jgi:hypothetical protein
MPDHLHVITDSEKKPGVIQRYINGVISRRVIDFLKAGGYASSLRSSGIKSTARPSILALGPSSECQTVDDESMFMQRVHYTPESGKLGLVERAEDYRFQAPGYR